MNFGLDSDMTEFSLLLLIFLVRKVRLCSAAFPDLVTCIRW